jgi:hypothetical protein
MTDTNNATQPATPTPPRKKRRGWWWKLPLILIVLLAVLVLLIPTIASTGPVRRYVTAAISENLNGKLEIADWSISWTGGISASGIKLLDRAGSTVVEIKRVTTELSMLDVVGGNFDAGKVDVVDPVLHIVQQPDGRTNLETIPKPKEDGGDDGAASSEPSDLPNVRADIHIANITGTLTRPGTPVVHLTGGTITARIPSINDPIEQHIELTARVGDGREGKILLDGTTQVVHDGRVDLQKLVAHHVAKLESIELATLNPLLAAGGEAAPVLGGVASGEVKLDADGIDRLVVDGALRVDDASLSGGPIGADALRLDYVNVPLKLSRLAGTDGSTLLKIESVGVEAPSLTLAARGELPEEALLRAISNERPGQSGEMVVTLNISDPSILLQLRNTLSLGPDVNINAGRLWSEITLWLTPDKAIAKGNASIMQLAGTRGDAPIRLSDIVVSFDATSLPTGGDLPDLRNLSLVVKSGFADIRGGGASLAGLTIDGDVDLDKLVSEASQFVDFGDLKLAGAAKFSVGVKAPGDVTQLKPGDALAVTASATLTNLTVAGLADTAPLTQPWLQLSADAQLVTGESGGVTHLRDARLTLQSGDPNTPTVDVLALIPQADLAAPAASFDLQRLAVNDLAELQRQFGPVLEALNDAGLSLQRGSIVISGRGSYDGPKPSRRSSTPAASASRSTNSRPAAARRC